MKQLLAAIFLALAAAPAFAGECILQPCNGLHACIDQKDISGFVCEKVWVHIDASMCTEMYGRCVRLENGTCGWEPNGEMDDCNVNPQQYRLKYKEWMAKQ